MKNGTLLQIYFPNDSRCLFEKMPNFTAISTAEMTELHCTKSTLTCTATAKLIHQVSLIVVSVAFKPFAMAYKVSERRKEKQRHSNPGGIVSGNKTKVTRERKEHKMLSNVPPNDIFPPILSNQIITELDA